jgi:hypothetical protein
MPVSVRYIIYIESYFYGSFVDVGYIGENIDCRNMAPFLRDADCERSCTIVYHLHC